jgi:hypothetical protein
MQRALRYLINTIFLNSPYIFDDDSQLSHHAQFDILRYETSGPVPKVLDIGLHYNSDTRMFRIDTSEMWNWRDPAVPLSSASVSGSALTENEREDVICKLGIFQAKHPKKFEIVGGKR